MPYQNTPSTMSTNNLPRITVTPTPTTQNQTTNPTWIFHDSTKPLPETGKLTQGLAEVSEKGLVFPAWGTILEPVHLKNVVVVVPNTKTSTESESGSSEEKPAFKGLTLEGLVEVCGTSSTDSSSTDSSSGAHPTAKPQVGDLAEGLWGDHATVLQYGKGKVVAVLEDVVVFLVKRPGGAIHPRMF